MLSLCLLGTHSTGRHTPMLWKLFEMNWEALLSQRFPFFILQVSFLLGTPVFIGAYLRKPTSKEGSGVYLTMGNLNRVCVKTEEMVPVGQQRAGATEV